MTAFQDATSPTLFFSPRRRILWFNSNMQTIMPDLLRQVSRSFYLTLRVLPGAIRPQIGLAYLLARTTDTIADTRLIPTPQRRAALRLVRAAILSAADDSRIEAPDFGELAEAQEGIGSSGSVAEKLLLERTGELLEALALLTPDDRSFVRDLLEIIIRGQDSDLARFGAADVERIAALETDEELEEYTYRVAGCVGEFWTKMCRAHLLPLEDLDDTTLLANGIRFGKGLQMINILRDLPKDLRQGRCYIPRVRLRECGLDPAALLRASEFSRFQPLFTEYLQQARQLLAAGWQYTNSLPRHQARIRLACAWPALIGARTLAHLAGGNVLDARRRIKVTRAEVHGIMIRSLLSYPIPGAWSKMFARAIKAESEESGAAMNPANRL
jgi:farnesyl-diphosphate farnesyltransferase